MGGDRPIRVKCWEKFLKSKGYTFKSKKGTSHDKWRCPGCIMSITFRGSEKEIPFAHIKTNLETMSVSADDFRDWVKNNC